MSARPTAETSEYDPFHGISPMRASVCVRQPSATMRTECTPRNSTSPSTRYAMEKPFMSSLICVQVVRCQQAASPPHLLLRIMGRAPDVLAVWGLALIATRRHHAAHDRQPTRRSTAASLAQPGPSV